MSATEPDRIWWTADELADARLPELPGTKRGINMIALRDGWQADPKRARKRRGRGGGWEYHWTLLPGPATRALLKAADEATERMDRGAAWAALDGLPDAAKKKAVKKLTAIQAYEALMLKGSTAAVAASEAARQAGVSARTVFNWLQQVEGVATDDRLAYLAPRHRLANRRVGRSADARQFMDWLKSDYLRNGQQSFAECYRDSVDKAKREGWAFLMDRTALRALKREVPRITRVFAREGVAGLERCFPPQIRDWSTLHAMEMVNADCHKIDVFVEWPDGTINRPQIIAFQDLYSRKMLSWRVDHSPNKVMVMSAFGEMVENWGLPRGLLVDNGREFANKWMTGGAPTRFRFKIVEDEPLGVLPLLGIKIHWATPGHGQAKPIERAFRDLASSVSRDVRFEGAYVGNHPDAKPENYGSRAVPLETFLRVLDERVAKHNAREGRLTPNAEGRSLDATFAESYDTAPIRKATEEQRRLWLTAQHVGKLHSQNGRLKIHGNYYHSAWMSQIAGETVVARFDPEDLHAGVHLYDKDGAFLGFAECQEKVGAFDMVEAKALSRRKARIKRAEKDLLEAHRPVSVKEIAADRDAHAPDPAAPLEAKVVAPLFPHRTTPAASSYRPAPNPELEAGRDALIVQMTPRAPSAPVGWRAPAEPDQRWALTQDIVHRSEAGEPVGREEARWLERYRTSDEYETYDQMARHTARDDTG